MLDVADDGHVDSSASLSVIHLHSGTVTERVELLDQDLLGHEVAPAFTFGCRAIRPQHVGEVRGDLASALEDHPGVAQWARERSAAKVTRGLDPLALVVYGDQHVSLLLVITRSDCPRWRPSTPE
nr:hypothetical protein [Streptomyces sp. ISL-98]